MALSDAKTRDVRVMVDLSACPLTQQGRTIHSITNWSRFYASEIFLGLSVDG